MHRLSIDKLSGRAAARIARPASHVPRHRRRRLAWHPCRRAFLSSEEYFPPGAATRNADRMHDDVIAHIRERVATMRKISGMAHDPRMIEMLDGMIEQAEA